MRPALKLLMIAGLGAAAAGCHKQQPQQPQDQNIAIDNGMPSNADIETLPADESSTTPSNQLENGSDNADVNAQIQDENSD